MCGLCGWVWTEEGRPVSEPALRGMLATLAHRGPDDSSIQLCGQAGLAHARLSIIDLSAHGRQPMSNEDETLSLVCNGEIYNFPELRRDLESLGHQFRSQSDSEVILHLYEEKGDDCVQHLKGMFAFSIWDKRRKRLFMARDRFGKKPLFYFHAADRLLFASESRAFFGDPQFHPAPDLRAIQLYLAYQSVPAPFSAFAGVKKLPAAHTLVWQKGRIQVTRYWHLTHDNPLPLTAEPGPEIYEELESRFRQAIQRRMRSDVPLGAMLSGGLDSSMIVAVLAEQGGAGLATFSAGFRQEEYDERPFARMVASHFGTRHEEILVGPESSALLPELVWHLSEPFGDSSALPTYLVCELAREKVRVVLSGDGGDECFAGYPRYQNIGEHSLKTGFPGVWERWHRRWKDWKAFFRPGKSWVENFRRFADLSQDRLLYYYRLAHFHEGYQERLLSPAFRKEIDGQMPVDLILQRFRESRARSFCESLMEIDLGLYLPDTLMTKTDTASMAHALEVRSPFLDHDLVEFCFRLPADWKLHQGVESKWMLRHLAAKKLPAEILTRKKMGFGIPMDQWFRGEWKELAYDTLLGDSLTRRGYFEKSYLQDLLDRHQQGESWQYLIWNVLMLELWHQMFIDRTMSAPQAHREAPALEKRQESLS